MAKKHGKQTKKPYVKTILLGIFSIILYITVFTHQDIITENFTKGQWYAVLPIITVFIFSFVHGAFASYVLSTLGIEAKRKK
ncbi:MAG: hypothetical protein KAQ85_01310 [Thermodesulfovibrionia bacterium]|nr:hypothetical protein [Thermodesulfovibrionia bacterium]